MRISPINNNYNFKGSSKTSNLGRKVNASIAAAMLVTAAIGYYKNKEVWDEFIKEQRQERVDNLRIKPMIKNFDTHESAINYAFDRTLTWLNSDSPKEYCVYIDNKTHNILTEIRGEDYSVTARKTLKMFAKEKLIKDFSYTSVHGHPGQKIGGTTTFSNTDLKTFLENDSCTEDYVLNKERKYCRLKKEDNYRKPTEKELKQILEDYERICNIAKPWQKIIKDRDGNIVFDFIDYPSMHDALDRYLKPFGISYTTTFGTYDGIKDIYANGYFEGFSGGRLLTSYTIKSID